MDHADLETTRPDRDPDATRPGGPATVPGGPAPVPLVLPNVPGYRIESVLGRGAMGVVYQAQHLALKRAVALKMVLGGVHASTEELHRFQVEVEAIARIGHPNIVQVYEVGAHEGQPYCALELAAGGSLADRLAGEPTGPGQAAARTETLARALHEAHRQRIVHRDLKPANVLIAADGTLKVTDFGLAKRLDTDEGRSRTGSVMGTPSYMAPEQAAGQEVGPAADVYALGAILYEMLTGRPPFRGTSVLDTLEQVRTREPVGPAKLQPGVPRDLETICLKCLEKEPARRYASAGALAEDLARFIAGEPVLARPVGAPVRALKWARRNRMAAALSGALSLAVVVGLAGVLYEWRVAVLERERALEAARRATIAQRAEAAARASAETSLYTYQLGLAESEWRDNRLGRALEVLGECPPAMRHWEWGWLAARCRPEVRRLDTLHPRVGGVAVSADGERLAAASYQRSTSPRIDAAMHETASVGVIEITSAAGLAPVTIDVGPTIVNVLAFAPDGQSLAGGDADGRLRIWSARTGAAASAAQEDPAPFLALAFSDDARRLLSGSGVTRYGAVPGTVTMRELPDSAGPEAPMKTLFAHELPGQRVTAVAIEAGGERAAYLARAVDEAGWIDPTFGMALGMTQGSTAPPRLVVVHLPGGETMLEEGVRGGRQLAFLPDGKRLAVLCTDAVAIVDLQQEGIETRRLPFGERGAAPTEPLAIGAREGGDLLVLAPSSGGVASLWNGWSGDREDDLRGFEGGPDRAAFSRGGTRVAASGAGTVRLYDLVRDKSSEEDAWAPRVFTSRDGAWKVRQEPDSRALVATGPGRELRLDGLEDGLGTLAFDPDGKQLAATGSGPGKVVLWDLGTGRMLRSKGFRDQTGALDFAAGGRRLVVVTGEEVRLLDTASFEVVAPLDEATKPFSISPDGRLLAVAARQPSARRDEPSPVAIQPLDTSREDGIRDEPSPGAIQLLDALTGECTRQWLADPSSVSLITWDAGGERLLTGGQDGTLSIWRITDGTRLAVLRGHASAVHAVVLSPDGRRAFTAAADQTIRVWDLEQGRQLLALPVPGAGPNGLALSTDGRTLRTHAGWRRIEYTSDLPGP